MNDNLSAPTPTERLLEALDPQGDVDLGLAVTVAAQLDADAQTVLAELIDRRLGRLLANLVLAEHARAAAQPGRHSIADTLALVDRLRRIAYAKGVDPGDQLREIRDEFGVHDGRIPADDTE